MPEPELKSIDDYELLVSETLAPWTAMQRTALAAAMAERWLPAYEAFAKQEDWGDAAALRRMLDSIWGHVAGRTLDAPSRARYATQLHDSTPHMDDFDAEEALAAAVILNEALRSCGSPDNIVYALGAALSGFEAVAPDWAIDPDEQARLWRKAAIRGELKKQLAVIEQISAIRHFDEVTVEDLRKRLTSKELVGSVPARREPTGPAKVSNQALFEQYRRVIELDRRSPYRKPAPVPGTFVVEISNFGVWAGRYGRRRQILKGEYGAPADTLGMEALVRWSKARDAADKRIPNWGQPVAEMMDMIMQNPYSGLDVAAVDAPHPYGPSLRRLWLEAEARGENGDRAWDHIIAWARHRPDSWATEDQRKKKGKADAPALGDRFARAVTWTTTDDPEHAWTAVVDGAQWQIRIGDFPDDYLYSLVIDGVVVGSFHDWPDRWER
jgi:uncharacterized protein YjaG (DUF416 family)